MSWKDDKNLGPWKFSEQPDRWGYLNNPRWTKDPKAVDFASKVGLSAGPTARHTPCGHWHKKKETAVQPSYDDISHWWWQPCIDVYENTIAIIPQWYEGEATDSIVCLVYDIPSATWKSYGEYRIQVVYGSPQECRISSDGSVYHFGSVYKYEDQVSGDPVLENNIYLPIIKFVEGKDPEYINLWEGNYDTGIPCAFYDYEYTDAIDVIGSRIVCAARLKKENGDSVNKHQVKISQDAGASFTTWEFPNTLSGVQYLKVKMDSNGICYLLRLFGSAPDNEFEVWKSNSGCTDFTKIYNRVYYGDLNNHAIDGMDAVFDVSENGNNITIFLHYKDGSNVYQAIYYSTNAGSSFNVITRTHNYLDFYPSRIGVSDGNESFVVHPGYSDIMYYSTDLYATYSEIIGPDGFSNYYADIARHNRQIAYTECGESFDGDPDYQNLLYSEDFGQTWTTINSPAPLYDDIEALVPTGSVTELPEEPQVWRLE